MSAAVVGYRSVRSTAVREGPASLYTHAHFLNFCKIFILHIQNENETTTYLIHICIAPYSFQMALTASLVVSVRPVGGGRGAGPLVFSPALMEDARSASPPHPSSSLSELSVSQGFLAPSSFPLIPQLHVC